MREEPVVYVGCWGDPVELAVDAVGAMATSRQTAAAPANANARVTRRDCTAFQLTRSNANPARTMEMSRAPLLVSFLGVSVDTVLSRRVGDSERESREPRALSPTRRLSTGVACTGDRSAMAVTVGRSGRSWRALTSTSCGAISACNGYELACPLTARLDSMFEAGALPVGDSAVQTAGLPQLVQRQTQARETMDAASRERLAPRLETGRDSPRSQIQGTALLPRGARLCCWRTPPRGVSPRASQSKPTIEPSTQLALQSISCR